MRRALVIACVLFVACDTPRVDQLLASSLAILLEEPPRKPKSAPPSHCADGAQQYAAPNVQLTIDCRRMKRDASVEWVTR